MIGFFPELYENELVYSLLARYYVRSGYMQYKHVSEDLFENHKIKPSIEFINKLTTCAYDRLTREKTIQEIIMQHTMYPLYAAFLPVEIKKESFQKLCKMDRVYNDLLKIPLQEKYLRYCPLCAEEHRKKYGETYWNREHQISGVHICHKHKCYLKNSDVRISSIGSPALISAELSVPKEDTVVFSNNDIEYKLAKYITSLFNTKNNIDGKGDIADFIHSRLQGTKYLSPRGQKRNIELLQSDLIKKYDFLEENPFIKKSRLDKLFSGKRHNFFEICLLAFFLEISEDDLVQMDVINQNNKESFDEKIKELRASGRNYRGISKELKMSYDYVKWLGGNNAKRIYKTKSIEPKVSRQHDWNKIDEEMLPKVKAEIRKILCDNNSRPSKITKGLVAKRLNVHKKYFNKCNFCESEILKYEESYEKYWARVIIWAICAIEKESELTNITQIIKVTNIRIDNIIKSIPYIESVEIQNKLKNIV